MSLDRSTTYLNALELVDSSKHEFSCCAIDTAARSGPALELGMRSARQEYASVFCPVEDLGYGAWLQDAPWSDGYGAAQIEKREWRLTALAFAAAMAATGDL